ncbi:MULTISPECIES: hypothetical protein [unclassified Novosphingobium]|uniref:hypothetical protein n=1 Tax=unclassified Novosphingobium TaxID=2644732 RepID=UPI001359C763|nr:MULTISPECIES: hypothetical protein [unclassified Novosphingobium]
MIIPHRLPLHIRSNDRPWRHRINIYDDAGQPVDMTGYGGKMQIRWYEGQIDDPVTALSTAYATAHGDGSPFSDGSFYISTDSGSGSRIKFDETGFEIAITHLDLIRFPPAQPNVPVLRFTYDILIGRAEPGDYLYNTDLPEYDSNAWFEGPLDFHYGVTNPGYERRPCPREVFRDPETGELESFSLCQHGIPGACEQYGGAWGCLWFSMPTNVPTSILRSAIWPDAA